MFLSCSFEQADGELAAGMAIGAAIDFGDELVRRSVGFDLSISGVFP
jgi:hypothetical protein